MADTWTGGGKIPIKPASAYRSTERHKTQTPDENLIHESPIDLLKLKDSGLDFFGSRGIIAHGNFLNGRPLPTLNNANLYEQDALILSFCHLRRRRVAERLGKKVCVQVYDIKALKIIIDKQLNCIGEYGPCEYRRDHVRNHFTKSFDDQWQREYRLLWKISNPTQTTIELPPGLAVQVTLE